MTTTPLVAAMHIADDWHDKCEELRVLAERALAERDAERTRAASLSAELGERMAEVGVLADLLSSLHPRTGVWRTPGGAAEEAVIEDALARVRR